MKKLLVLWAIFPSLFCFGCNNKKQVAYDAIIYSFAKMNNAYYSDTSEIDSEFCDRYFIEKFLGMNGNAFAITICGYEENYLDGNCRLMPLEFGDYKSESYYYRSPYIYKNKKIYSLVTAYEKKIVNLDFIKTFDDFQKEHIPEELKDIYI